MNRLIFAVCLTLLVLSDSAMAETQYTMTELAPIYGYQHSNAWGISDMGYVAGEMYQNPAMYDARAFRWRSGTGMENLGTLSEDRDSWGYDVNDSGMVVGAGTGYIAPSSPRPVAYESPGPLYELGGFGWAMGVNNHGTVVGRANSNPYDLSSGTLLDSHDGTAYDINDNSRVVGSIILDLGTSTREVGRLWDINTSTWKPLNPVLGQWESRTNGINENGDRAAGLSGNVIMGQATAWEEQYPDGPWDSFALPYLDTDNDEYSFAAEINNEGTLVGSSGIDGYILTQRACLWEETAPGVYEVYDLNNLIDDWTGWRLAEARDINENGQIVGTMVRGAEESTEYRAFLLTPVPEPGTLVLLITAGLGALGYAWRRRRS